MEEENLDVMEELGSDYHMGNVVPSSGRQLRVILTGARLPDSVKWLLGSGLGVQGIS